MVGFYIRKTREKYHRNPKSYRQGTPAAAPAVPNAMDPAPAPRAETSRKKGNDNMMI